jgi:hypothetical protein
MKTTPDTKKRFVLLGSTAKSLRRGVLPPGVWVCQDRSDLESAIASATGPMTWVSFTRSSTDLLLATSIDARADLSGARLIVLTPPRPESIPALLGLFHPVFGLGEGSRWLPTLELVEAITTDDASDRFIGGSVDRKAKTLTLLRGDMTSIVAPFRLFPISGDGIAPDFAKLRLTDYGRTIVLGGYEASADAILYELDPDYRRRLNRHRRDRERTFGASLLRLRKQQRLKRTDFAPISSREIARIERNEVERPQAKTLEIVADRLGVRPHEIASY